MDFNKTKKALQDFGKNVVIAARKNLKKKWKVISFSQFRRIK